MNVIKFAAHYMLTPSDLFVKWPLITIREDGLILKIESFPSGMKEEAGVRFFSGILLPAFVDVHNNSPAPVSLSDKRFLNRHFADGTMALGVKDPSPDLLSRDRLPLIFPQNDETAEYENSFEIPPDASRTVFQRIKSASKTLEGTVLADVLMHFTMDAARAIGITKAGCLAAGFAPGLLLLQNADLSQLRMTPAATVKWLVVPSPDIIDRY